MCQNNKNAKYKEEKNIRKTYLKKNLKNTILPPLQ